MSSHAAAWAWRHSPLTGVGLTIHIALADRAGDAGLASVVHAELAAQTRASAATVKRALADLRASGLVELVAEGGGRGHPNTYRVLCPAGATAFWTPTEGVQGEPLSRERGSQKTGSSISSSTSRDQQPTEEQTLFGEPVHGDPLSVSEPDPGVVVARAVFEQRHPRPAIPFPAVCQIARKLIDAGHEPDAITAAMVEADTISVRWVEAALTRRARTARGAVATDRTRPEGTVRL